MRVATKYYKYNSNLFVLIHVVDFFCQQLCIVQYLCHGNFISRHVKSFVQFV